MSSPMLPDVDLADEHGWRVTARLPGFAPEEVEVDDRELSVRARSADTEALFAGEPGRSRRRTISVGRPGDVPVIAGTATYGTDGDA